MKCKDCIHNEVCDKNVEKRCSNYERMDPMINGCSSCLRASSCWGNGFILRDFNCEYFSKGLDKEYINTTLNKILELDEDLGIYPKAVYAQNEEDSYEERDGFKNGWNQCQLEFLPKVREIIFELKRNLGYDE